MKITETKNKYVNFCDLNVGDVFYYQKDDLYFMRVLETEKGNSVCLSDGTFETFSGCCEVRRVDNAELVV